VSQQNVELAFRGNDAFNRRDLVAFLALLDPDVELIPYEVSIEGGGLIAATTASAPGGKKPSRFSPISRWR
jgi:hypothetical protein